VFVLQIVSVGFIAVGIFKIGMLARKGENNTGIKVCRMIIHCASMVLYLPVFFFYYKYWQLKTWANLNNYRYAQSVGNCITLVSQILMFSVLWPLTVKKTPPNSVAQEPVWIEYDEEAEVQERIWHLLVRRVEIEQVDRVDLNPLSKSETQLPTDFQLSVQPAVYMSLN
jgi:hypothetical protein